MKVLLALALLMAPAVALANIPDPPPLSGKPVVDAANIIPDDEEAKLDAKLMDIAKRSHHQVAVLTVPDLQGYSIDDYGVNAGRKWGIGSKYSDDGVLITIAPKEHKKRIDVGYGLGGMLTDARVSEILPKATPPFRAGNYAEGINLMVDDVAEAITPLTPEQLALKQREEANRKAASSAMWAKVGDFFLTLFGIVVIAAIGFGIYWKATAKARLLKREERERQEQEARERERQRLAVAYREQAKRDAAQREREAAERAEEARQREAMLAAMSPTKRAAFLETERRDAEEAEARRSAALAASAAAAETARVNRRRDDDDSFSSSSSYSSDSSSSSSDDSFSGGGGSFGGGGGSDGW